MRSKHKKKERLIDAYNQASLDRTSYFVPRSASGCRCGYILAACYRRKCSALVSVYSPTYRSRLLVAFATQLCKPEVRSMQPAPHLSFLLCCVRHGSNALDSSVSTERCSPVMLSPCASLKVNSAKHLAAACDRPFASLRVTVCDGSNGQRLFFTSEL